MWLLEKNIKQIVENAIANGYAPTAEQREEFSAQKAGGKFSTVNTKTAVIDISGILTKEPSILAAIFGGGNTTYSEISEALAKAESSAAITDIQLNIDSPGGEVNGWFETLDHMDTLSKPITAYVGGMAASAAYGIAAKADKIIAKGRGARIGSIGAAVSIPVDDGVVDIASTNAPEKRPDATTKEGIDIIRKDLDAVELMFMESVATGRDTTVANVKKNFGCGGMFFAEEAKERGMIDEIAGTPRALGKTKIKAGGKTVDLQILKAEHSAVFLETVELGVKQERDRVCAHLTLGEKSGDMSIAIEAINSGADMTMSLQAKYISAGMNHSDMSARVEDNPAEGVAPAAAENKADLVVNAMVDYLGDGTNV